MNDQTKNMPDATELFCEIFSRWAALRAFISLGSLHP